jgi:oxygen-dependent protoporphyrinogen oxidase
MKEVAIIGGGITGLTAAYRLRGRGLNVRVFEGAQGAGGVVRTTAREGFLAEHGPNSILITSPAITSLVHDAGLDARVVSPGAAGKNRFIVRAGRPVCLPLTPPQFVTTPLFSLRAKLRLVAEPFISAAPADREESLSEFVLRRLGREFLDYAINPFVAGVYAGDPEMLSVRHSFPKLHALEQKYGSLIRGQIKGRKERAKREEVGKNEAGMISFDTGLQLLTDTLAASLGERLKLGTSVEGVSGAGGKWRIALAGGGGPEGEFDAVLFAGGAHTLARMGSPGAGPSPEPLNEVHYPPVSSLVMGFRRGDIAHPLDGFGILIPEVEPFAILGVLFSSSLFPGRAPEGHVTLTCFLGGTRRPETATGETGEVVETAMRDLRALVGLTGEPVFIHRTYYDKAIPQYNVGYGRYLDLMGEMEKANPGYFIAGNIRDGISLGNSIVSGNDAAGRIAAYLGMGD